MRFSLFKVGWLLCLLLVSGRGAETPALPTPKGAPSKPVFLYSLAFNAPGENRYTPTGAYKTVLQRLESDFAVRIQDQPLTPQSLRDVRLLLLSNPNDMAHSTNPPPRHVSSADIETLTAFVQGGGGLIILGNQENHNLETTDLNRLLSRFGILMTNQYTDAKLLSLPSSAPVVGGLHWGYYTGNSLILDPRHPAHPRALVENDLTQKPAKGPRDTPGVLMASAQLGQGRVVVVTDAGWIADPALLDVGIGGVQLPGQENWPLFQRLARWAGRQLMNQ